MPQGGPGSGHATASRALRLTQEGGGGRLPPDLREVLGLGDPDVDIPVGGVVEVDDAGDVEGHSLPLRRVVTRPRSRSDDAEDREDGRELPERSVSSTRSLSEAMRDRSARLQLGGARQTEVRSHAKRSLTRVALPVRIG